MSTTTIPRESQRERALRLANQIRLYNADVLKKIRTGELDPVTALKTQSLSVPLNRFLKAVPHVGGVKANEIAKAAGVPYDHRLGGRYSKNLVITERQRDLICSALRERGFGE